MYKFFHFIFVSAGLVLAVLFAACSKKSVAVAPDTVLEVSVYETIDDYLSEYDGLSDDDLLELDILAVRIDNPTDTLNDSEELIYCRLPAIFEENATITEVYALPDYDGRVATVFQFKDSDRWERVTRRNVGRRLAMGIDDKIMSVCMVSTPVSDGGCSIFLPKEEMAKYLPGIDLDDLEVVDITMESPLNEPDRYQIMRDILIVVLSLCIAYLVLRFISICSGKLRYFMPTIGIVIIMILPLCLNIHNPGNLLKPISLWLFFGFAICIAVFIALCLKVRSIAYKEIKSREDVEIRARYVNSLAYILPFAIAFYTVGVMIATAYDGYCYDLSGDWVISICKFTLILTILVALGDGLINQISSPIHTSDIVGNLDRFNLYLRSFEADDSLARKEKILCKSFDRLFPTYAIGNPNAVVQPLGAHRIYADDSEWQEVVAELMDKARLVIMRCATTDGAIWELNRLMSQPRLLMKCVFVVDSSGDYDFLCQELSKRGMIFEMPQLNFDGGQYGVLIMHDGNQYVLHAAPLDRELQIRSFIKFIVKNNKALGKEYAAMRRWRHTVHFYLLSKKIPPEVNWSFNWSLISPLVSCRHWPWYYLLITIAVIGLSFCTVSWIAPLVILIFLLFLFIFGNTIEWAQRPYASAALYMKERRREASLMWISTLFTAFLAFCLEKMLS